MTLVIGEPRKVSFATQAMVNAYRSAADRAWKNGDYVGRLSARVRELEIVRHFGNKIYPDIPWTLSFLDDEHIGPVVSKQFENLCLLQKVIPDGINGDGFNLREVAFANSVIVFSVMKCLAKSDTSPWFSVEEDLAYSLLSTRFHGVMASDVVVPFPGFCLELPRGLLQIYDDRFGFRDLRTIIVSEGMSIVPSYSFLKFDNYHVKDWERLSGRRLSILSLGEPSPKSKSFRDDGFMYDTLPLHNDSFSLECLAKSVDEVIERDDPNVVFRDLDTGGSVFGFAVNRKVLLGTISSFVISFLLYLVSKDADVVSGEKPALRAFRGKKKTAAIKRKIQAIKSQPDFVVGSRVVIDPKIRQVMQASAAVGGISKAVNVLVRGHWRHVWHGKKTEESPKGEGRRPVWVQPFVRNKATGAVLGHQYEVR